MSEPAALGHAAAQSKIGWFTASCVLVSNMIGGGIFTTTGFMARDLGDPLLILSLWLVGGLLAMAAAMAYSELPAMLPRAGGDYIYLRQAYGPFVGFLSGWTSFTVGFGAGIAAAAVSFASYALRLMPLAEDNSPASKTIALLLVWIMTAVHAAGTGAGGRLQRVLTTTKVSAIILLILGGLLFGHGSWEHVVDHGHQGKASVGSLIVALIFVIYTYLGWNVVGYIAGEIAEPQRMIPKIVIGGTAFVASLYLLLNLL
ncbi:MAG TPA: amino acid permease, partial [Nitrospiraceae bacterium]|nr:amino acid permease [Nitrospiraceae bacterium]